MHVPSADSPDSTLSPHTANTRPASHFCPEITKDPGREGSLSFPCPFGTERGDDYKEDSLRKEVTQLNGVTWVGTSEHSGKPQVQTYKVRGSQAGINLLCWYNLRPGKKWNWVVSSEDWREECGEKGVTPGNTPKPGKDKGLSYPTSIETHSLIFKSGATLSKIRTRRI